jgi:aldose 1-epimerase
LNSFSIENEHLKAVFLDYGAILHQLWFKDKNGVPTNLIMGLDQPQDYLTDDWVRGAVVGRFAGRLENPIQIEGTPIEIEHKDGVLLHSGSSGWHKKQWTPLAQENDHSITFEYQCPDGSSGFIGTVHARVSYRLEGSSLGIEYHAVPSETTHINLTNHAYFNLNPTNTIGSQQLRIDADHFLELKESLVPTGKKLAVENSTFDFREEKAIGNIRLDDYFVVNQNKKEIASLYSPDTGIVMKTLTDQPGVVVFTPPHFEAICFETQKFSNSPNIPTFPSTLIKANEEYTHRTRFEFSLKNQA